MATPSHEIYLDEGTIGHGAYNMEVGRCDPGPTTSWAQSVVFSIIWRFGTKGRTRTITCSWVASLDPRLPRTCAISGNAQVFRSSLRRPRTGFTTYLLISGRTFRIHPSGNASARHGYHCKPGVSSMPGFQHTGPGTNKTPGG